MSSNIRERFSVPVCPIWGVDIAVTDMDKLLSFTAENVKELSGEYIAVANVHTTVTAGEDENYRDIFNASVMAIPDGGPLSTVAHKRGFPEMQRTTGPSYMGEVLKMSGEYGWTHYFYGSTPETLEKLRATIEKDFPGAKVVGMYSPPFRPMTEEEDKEITEQINSLSPDFVWVGLGAVKQEKWMAAHRGRVHGLMVGVGAAFDYYAGNISRAPQWMQKANLEWLYRLMQEPRRLFKRYFVTNTKFIWHVVIRGK